MNNLRKLLFSDRIKEIFRFVLVGGLTFLVDYGLMIVLTELLKINYLISTGVSFSISVVVNYFLCVLWVFENVNRRSKKSIIIFIGSSIIGLALNQLFMMLLVEILGIYYMISKCITTLLVMIWNYIMKRKAVYKKNDFK